MKKLYSLLFIFTLYISVWGQAYNIGYPSITNIAETTATVYSNIDTDAYITSFVVLPAADPTPTMQNVLDWSYDGNGGTLTTGTYGDIQPIDRFGNILSTANTEYSFDISNLTTNTNYKIYLISTSDWNTQTAIETSSPTEISFSTVAVLPAYNTGYPNVSNINTTTCNIFTKIDTDLYETSFVILPASDPAPTIQNVLDWSYDGNGGTLTTGTYGDIQPLNRGSIASIANTEYSITATNLTASTNYVIYLVSSTNYTAANSIETVAPTEVTFTTLDLPPDYNSGYPNTSNISTTTCSINTNIDTDLYETSFIILLASDPVPTIQNVLDWSYDGNGGTLTVGTYGDIQPLNRSNIVSVANTEYSITATNLTSSTDYIVYLISSTNWTAANAIETTSPTAVAFSTLAGNPQWSATYPYLQNQSKTAIDAYGQVNASGNYYLVLTQSNVAPTEAQIKAGQDENGAAALVTATANVIADTEFISNLDISSLSSETNYWVYIVVENSPSLFSSIQQLPFTTLDTQAPTYNTNYPAINLITGTSSTVEVQINEDGHYYWVVLLATDPTPSISQVLSGTDAGDNPVSNSGNGALSADNTGQGVASGLTSETDYITYLVTRDNNTNYIETTVATAVPFTTADVTSPVATFDPVDIATDVDVNKTITISFNEAIYNTLGEIITSANVSTIARLNETYSGGTSVPATITYDAINFIITIDPTSTLKELQLYNIHLAQIQDASANSTSIINSTFTTNDVTAPVTTFTDPTDGQINYSIGSQLIINFNESVRNLDGSDITALDLETLISFSPTVTFTASLNANGDAITVSPDSYLTPNTSYTFTMNPVEDIYGNEQSLASSIGFTTAAFNTWNGNAGDNNFSNSTNWDVGYTSGASCIIPSGTPEVIIGANSTFPNMVIEPLGKVTINSSVTVTLSDGLTLKNDATGTGSLINNGTISVSSSNVKIEQNISDPSRYNYACSPVQNATMNNIGGDGSIYTWNNINGTWDAFDANTNMSAGYGYLIKSSQDLIFSGALNNSDYTIAVKGTPKNAGWTLAGNPYTAAIDWESINPADMVSIQDAFWIWLTTNQYGSWNGVAGVGTNLEANSLIPGNHAFWVRADWTSGQTIDGTLVLRKTYLTHNTNSYLKSAGSTTNIPYIKLSGIHDGTRDEKVIAFSPGAKESFELYDSEKRFGSNPNTIELYSIVEGKKLTINTYPSLSDNMIIPLGYKTQTAGTFKIKLDETPNFDNDLQVLLTDTILNTTTNLSTEGNYEFYSEAINTADRFYIKLISPITTSNNNEIVKDETKIYAVQKTIYIGVPDLINPQYELYDISGKLIKKDTLTSESLNELNMNKNGVYIVKVISKSLVMSKKVVIN